MTKKGIVMALRTYGLTTAADRNIAYIFLRNERPELVSGFRAAELRSFLREVSTCRKLASSVVNTCRAHKLSYNMLFDLIEDRRQLPLPIWAAGSVHDREIIGEI